jgi:hypothetical protein
MFRLRDLIEERFDPLGEGVSGAVQPALHGPEVYAGDLGDLLVALSLEFAQLEHQPMVLGQLLHGVFNEALEIPLPIEIVGPHPEIFELDGAVVVVPTVREPLEENQRTP